LVEPTTCADSIEGTSNKNNSFFILEFEV